MTFGLSGKLIETGVGLGGVDQFTEGIIHIYAVLLCALPSIVIFHHRCTHTSIHKRKSESGSHVWRQHAAVLIMPRVPSQHYYSNHLIAKCLLSAI
jgi:hypothetical protein